MNSALRPLERNASTALNVLVIDDEKDLLDSVTQMIEGIGHRVFPAESAEVGIQEIKSRGPSGEQSFHMALIDVNLPGMSGIEALREIRRFDPAISVLIITAHGSIEDAVLAMREGAYGYIEKPVDEDDVVSLVHKARDAHDLVHEMGLSSPRLHWAGGREFIGDSRQMQSLFRMIERLGQVTTSVLIRGENGTGKELVARAIHYNGPRKRQPFVAVNCAAVAENLIESELFGHEKGAFTGADRRKIGHFQSAEGGTLFLDEIGDISPGMQVKLLRVLQERKFTPVGSTREIPCDVRIVAATNQPLEKLIDTGKFREDLFYRLNVMPISLPPLRERTNDIPGLVDHFVQKFNRTHERETPIRGVSPAALDQLQSYRWPGNIRQLENTIERAFVLEPTSQIGVNSLPSEVTGQASPYEIGSTTPFASERSDKEMTDRSAIDFQNEKEQFERDFIVRALRTYGGRINQTAAHAGIPKNTLLRKMRKYGIDAQAVAHGGHVEGPEA
jgi:two-component system response regulator AtoC